MSKQDAILSIFLIGSIFGFSISSIIYSYQKSKLIEQHVIILEEELTLRQQDFYTKSPKEGLMDCLLYFDIEFPEIVYAQAILESGHFTSKVCKDKNNLFGLYNSNKNEYYSFEHWTDSVLAYKRCIQSKYKEGSYYDFLNNIGYAKDPLYIDKLKKLTNNN